VEHSLQRKYSGAGLGLAICRGIVESQNGKIWVKSKLGEGSNFYFTIPYKPVEDVKPIKLLFSPRADIYGKIERLFVDILGPVGSSEFKILESKKQLSEKELHDYLAVLSKKRVIDDEMVNRFRKGLGAIFGFDLKHEKKGSSKHNLSGKDS
jgi:hypothetical protein